MTPSYASSPEHFWFDSDLLTPDEGFARYRELYSGGADAVLLGPGFHAKVRGWRLDRVLMFDRRVNALGHSRDADRVARNAIDHFTLTLVCAGLYEVDAGQGWQAVPAGQAVLLDMLAPMRNRMHDAHIVTISFARDRMQSTVGATDGLHGFVVNPVLAALLFDYVGSLLKRIEVLHADALEPATVALCALLAIAIGGRDESDRKLSGARRDALRIGRVRAMVDANIGDPAFGADAAIALSGLSRATLYRVFRAQGGLAGYIQARRLERVRMALIDGGDPRSFAEIAFATGFTSESHCSRLFRERFGMRPGEYRAASALPADDDPQRRMRIWQDDVR